MQFPRSPYNYVILYYPRGQRRTIGIVPVIWTSIIVTNAAVFMSGNTEQGSFHVLVRSTCSYKYGIAVNCRLRDVSNNVRTDTQLVEAHTNLVKNFRNCINYINRNVIID